MKKKKQYYPTKIWEEAVIPTSDGKFIKDNYFAHCPIKKNEG
jgi:hypothetical protein